jgi:formate hydrogenlyase transcriptional activator
VVSLSISELGSRKSLDGVMILDDRSGIVKPRVAEGDIIMWNVSEREMIGESARFKKVLEQVSLVAPVDCAVLIEGETGTGKELIARAIHDHSRRSTGPFVKLNCAAIPAGLLESELFGHERGAFTGAVAQTVGRLQLAHKGTLFLDEIGDLPAELQPKLLRAIQEQEFERLGSSKTIRVDVRIVAATNQNLAQMVNERRFRADLYYRLNVFPLMLPPLRDRVEDIPNLVHHFVREFAARMNKVIDGVPGHVMEALCLHDWPGNIRELQNFIERAVVMTEGRMLSPQLSELTPMAAPTSNDAGQTLAEVERVYITETLQNSNWVVGGREGAAAKLGLPRTTLLARMRKLGIARDTLEPRGGWLGLPATDRMQADDSREAFAHAVAV